jgi:hypothetical protein
MLQLHFVSFFYSFIPSFSFRFFSFLFIIFHFHGRSLHFPEIVINGIYRKSKVTYHERQIFDLRHVRAKHRMPPFCTPNTQHNIKIKMESAVSARYTYLL